MHFVVFLNEFQAGFMLLPPPSTDTVPEERVFKVALGQFALDVVLLNITFPYGVLSVRDANVRGFNIQEHITPDGNLKIFTLEVPFTDPFVLQRVGFDFSFNF